MDVAAVMVQQLAQAVESNVAMIKQTSKSDKAAVQLVEQALEMAKVTAPRGQNLNMVI